MDAEISCTLLFHYFLPLPSYSEENDVVPKVVEAILSLPENTHMAVRHTSVLLLGELCEWIERHPQSLGKSMLHYWLCNLDAVDLFKMEIILK
jgi:hypothetical protein